MFTKAFTVGIVILLLVKTSTALKCYYCTSELGQGADDCNDPPNTSRIGRMECTTNFETECIKYTVEKQSRTILYRGCFAKTTNTCELFRNATETSFPMKVTYCGTCTQDYCNSTNITIVSGKLLLIFLLTFVYL